jgi:nucleolar protein 58
VGLMEYRRTLYEYLTSRMNAIAPNLTVMVGELVGARLVAHAGSLMNLAKQPASTVQILGAEKALFRALKTKHETPKYGLIYHASLVGQCAPKNKGKISRVLAAKTALAIRVDALGEGDDVTVGNEGREKVEARMRQLEGLARIESTGGAKYGPRPCCVRVSACVFACVCVRVRVCAGTCVFVTASLSGDCTSAHAVVHVMVCMW